MEVGTPTVPTPAIRNEHVHDAHSRYGCGHPARRNHGDRVARALSVSAGEPPLFKREDFARTDVLVARESR